MMAGKYNETGLFLQQNFSFIQFKPSRLRKCSTQSKVKQMCQILTIFSFYPLLQLISKKTNLNKILLNSFSANFTKWSNTLKQFVGNLPTNCLSVFDNFVGLALKGLSRWKRVYSRNFRFCKGFETAAKVAKTNTTTTTSI